MKTCRTCKTNFEPFKIQNISSAKCIKCLHIKPLKRKITAKKRTVKKKKRKKKPKLRPIKFLKRDLDSVFSKFIRKRDKGKCFTCGVVKPEKNMQNGHYVSRSHMSLRFDEKNCFCQCVGCNVFKNGNMAEYTFRIKDKFGIEHLEYLQKKKEEIQKYTRQDYERLINHYKELI